MPCTCASMACSVHLTKRSWPRAVSEQRILISAGDLALQSLLLASRPHAAPSVVLLRRLEFHRADFVVALLLANLAQLAEPLELGSFVVLEEHRIRAPTAADQPDLKELSTDR